MPSQKLNLLKTLKLWLGQIIQSGQRNKFEKQVPVEEVVDAAFEVSEGVTSFLGECEEVVLASGSLFVAIVLLNPLELALACESVGSEEAVNEQDIIGKLNYLA